MNAQIETASTPKLSGLQSSLPHDKPSGLSVAGLPVAALSVEQAAREMIDYCQSPQRWRAELPFYSTSINGQVLSHCWRSARFRSFFETARSIHCDGQPIVLLSHLLAKTPLPERVATTDLFPVVARMTAEAGLSFYILGATEEVNKAAIKNIKTNTSYLADCRCAKRLFLTRGRAGNCCRNRCSQTGHPVGVAGRTCRAGILR